MGDTFHLVKTVEVVKWIDFISMLIVKKIFNGYTLKQIMQNKITIHNRQGILRAHQVPSLVCEDLCKNIWRSQREFVYLWHK
jgi:hypothetical protein